MYIDYAFYKTLYDDDISEEQFGRLEWKACKKVDTLTTGVDGVRKLKVAFPTDEEDAVAVKRCVAEIINTAKAIEDASNQIAKANSFVEQSDGTLKSKMVSSISSGSESISYSNKVAQNTVIDSVLSDKKAQEDLYNETIVSYLSGVQDKNGISLLYMGEYPHIQKNASIEEV